MPLNSSEIQSTVKFSHDRLGKTPGSSLFPDMRSLTPLQTIAYFSLRLSILNAIFFQVVVME